MIHVHWRKYCCNEKLWKWKNYQLSIHYIVFFWEIGDSVPCFEENFKWEPFNIGNSVGNGIFKRIEGYLPKALSVLQNLNILTPCTIEYPVDPDEFEKTQNLRRLHLSF